MYARSTTIQADPNRLDAGIGHVRDEVMPTVQDMEGCIGLSMLCDRDSGRCIVTTSWGSEEAMRATTESVREMRERAAEMLGGAFDVQEWEVVAMHRHATAGDDACARVTWASIDPDNMDRAIDAMRMSIIPRLDDLPGFCSVSMMVDRTAGKCSLTAVYADRQSLDASREQVMGMREEFARQMSMDVDEVAEMDLVIHHLRVPEMA